MLSARAQPKPPFATMAQWDAYKAALDFLNHAYNVGAWIGERGEDGRLYAMEVRQVQALVEQWARTFTLTKDNCNGQ